jgi:hypothetical protein
MESATQQTHHNTHPILVIDRSGELGTQIAKNFAAEKICVLVTAHPPVKTDNLIYVPYKKNIPRIPNSAFVFFYLVYSGDRHLMDLLPNFVRKAKEDNTHIFFLLNIRNITEDLLQKLANYGSLITTIIIGDILNGEETWANPVNTIIHTAQTGSVLLPENGIFSLFPVAEHDVFGVIKATAHQKEAAQTRTIYVLPSEPVTAMSFSRFLLKTEPLLRIDYSEAKSGHPAYPIGTYQSVFGQNYPIESKIPSWSIMAVPAERPKKSKRVRRRRLPKMRGLSSVIVISVFVFMLLAVSPLLLAAIGGGLMLQAQTNLKKGDMQSARSDATAAKQFFGFAAQSDILMLSALEATGLHGTAGMVRDNISTGSYVAQLAIDGVDGFTLLKKVFNGTSLDPKHDFVQGLNNMKYALTQLATLQAEDRIPAQYKNQVQQLSLATAPLVNTFDVLPTLFGMNGKRIYLVLFQNNMELRPGGGFIGSYALVTVDKGKIADLKIQDVYSADGQLRDHIDPPFQLRRYLGSQHWFLRDSNFDVDFSNNAAMAGYFYNLEMGKKVDGTLAVDISFVRNLLGAIGPIRLQDYGETITADNFFQLTEEHAQNNFFPGSTQKRDFLSNVYNNVFLKLTESHDLPYEKLVLTVGKSIQEKHFLLGFPDTGMQKLFSVNGLSSSLSDSRPAKEGTINDFFGINEANLGQNKSNAYLNRSVTHSVILNTTGTASETATISYQNRSTAKSVFGGDYKAYIRLILPAASSLTSVTIDGQPQPTIDAVTNPALYGSQLFRPPSQLEVEQTQQSGKTLFGFLLIVPGGAKKTVSISYSVNTDRAANASTVNYNLRLFKQPGTEADPYILSVAYPAGYGVLGTLNGGREQGGIVKYFSDISQDREFSFQVTKQ